MPNNTRYITAFGSSRIQEHEPIFQDVYNLSSSIAQQGWHGITGGHQGMMAAFSQGICAGGSCMRGITLECFPTPPNNSLTEEIRAQHFFDRMQQMIEQADAYLVLPGGLGTLSELAMTWDLIAIHILKDRPCILYGEMWEPIISTLQKELIMSVDHAFDTIHICRTHEEVLSLLQ